MERLTSRDEFGNAYHPYCFREDTCNGEGSSAKCSGCKLVTDVCSKLADYEDLEEQGLLLRLPCRIGDDVYQIPSKVNYDLNVLNGHERNNRVYHQKVSKIVLDGEHWYLECDKDREYGTGRICLDTFFGETWFLSKEEAEQKLAEYKGE